MTCALVVAKRTKVPVRVRPAEGGSTTGQCKLLHLREARTFLLLRVLPLSSSFLTRPVQTQIRILVKRARIRNVCLRARARIYHGNHAGLPVRVRVQTYEMSFTHARAHLIWNS